MSPLELMPTELIKDGWLVQDQVYEEWWWFNKYWDSTQGSQRDAIIGAMEGVGDFGSVLEIGCHVGPNLRRIHQRWPTVDLLGMDIHPGAIQFGREHAAAEGWHWAGYPGDLRELGLLGAGVADVVLSCYSLAYLDPRDIDAVLAAALACATKAVIVCEPMVVEGEEFYVPPGPKTVAEYHYHYISRLSDLGNCRVTLTPLIPPHARLNALVTALK